MSLTHKLTRNLNVVSCHGQKVSTEEIYNFSIEMMSDSPGVQGVPNIWDFTDSVITGDLGQMDELFEAIGPRIVAPAKVGFVANIVLTVAIAKRYSDMFRTHKYLRFETFTSLAECRRWALAQQ